MGDTTAEIAENLNKSNFIELEEFQNKLKFNRSALATLIMYESAKSVNEALADVDVRGIFVSVK